MENSLDIGLVRFWAINQPTNCHAAVSCLLPGQGGLEHLLRLPHAFAARLCVMAYRTKDSSRDARSKDRTEQDPSRKGIALLNSLPGTKEARNAVT